MIRDSHLSSIISSLEIRGLIIEETLKKKETVMNDSVVDYTWKCSCGHINLDTRTYCFNCGEDK